MNIEFKHGLGDKVKDVISGYTGIIVCAYRWRSGCNRYTVQAQELDKGVPVGNHCFDECDLQVIEAGAVPFDPVQVKQDPGGPRPSPVREGH